MACIVDGLYASEIFHELNSFLENYLTHPVLVAADMLLHGKMLGRWQYLRLYYQKQDLLGSRRTSK